jgi:hypothetical protein
MNSARVSSCGNLKIWPWEHLFIKLCTHLFVDVYPMALFLSDMGGVVCLRGLLSLMRWRGGIWKYGAYGRITKFVSSCFKECNQCKIYYSIMKQTLSWVRSWYFLIIIQFSNASLVDNLLRDCSQRAVCLAVTGILKEIEKNREWKLHLYKNVHVNQPNMVNKEIALKIKCG